MNLRERGGRPAGGDELGREPFAWLTSLQQNEVARGSRARRTRTVLPLVSARRVMPLSGRAYQKRVGGAGRFRRLMILTGMPLGIGRDDAEDAIGPSRYRCYRRSQA